MAAPVHGVVSAANSLVGGTAGDMVGLRDPRSFGFSPNNAIVILPGNNNFIVQTG